MAAFATTKYNWWKDDFKKYTKLSNKRNMQHNQFISTFQLLVGLLFPEIKNSLGEIVYQKTTCPLILHWRIEFSWILPCNAAISDLWQSVEYQLSLSTSLLLPHHTVEEFYEQVVFSSSIQYLHLDSKNGTFELNTLYFWYTVNIISLNFK